jgi:hypothetical protein
MIELITNVGQFENVLWFIAIATSIIFLIQFILLLFGGDSGETEFQVETDFQTDNIQHDVGHSFQFLSIRNGITFLMFTSWGTLYLIGTDVSPILSILFGIGVGVVVTFIMSLVYYMMFKLQTNNVPTLNGIVGKIGTVYLRIPKRDMGMGKITIMINGSINTIDAISYDEELKTGDKCVVIAIINDTIPIVKAISLDENNTVVT